MKGIVFNLLEELVRRDHGGDTWDRLLDNVGLQGVYTSIGTYPDSDLVKLVGGASSALAVSPEDVLRWFGRNVVPQLAKRSRPFSARVAVAICQAGCSARHARRGPLPSGRRV